MAFRETRAWIALATMMLAYIPYFVLVPPASGQILPEEIATRLIWFGAATVGWGVAYGLALAVFAARTPRPDRAQADERDRLIDARAAGHSYYFLMALMILVGVVMPFGNAGWQIFNAALLAIVLAEALRHALIIVAYRRGEHG